jgi:hypothetical protein
MGRAGMFNLMTHNDEDLEVGKLPIEDFGTFCDKLAILHGPTPGKAMMILADADGNAICHGLFTPEQLESLVPVLLEASIRLRDFLDKGVN